MVSGIIVRKFLEQRTRWEFLQRVFGRFLAVMFNGGPGMFGYYGNRRPPPNLVAYPSPMGLQFSPRGYQEYSQNYPQQGPSFAGLSPQHTLQDPAIVYASRSNKRPYSQYERPSPNKRRRWQEPQLYGSNKINDKITDGVWTYFENYRQTDEMYRNKLRLRNALYAVFKDVFPYCGLYIVGSSMSGFGTKTSDMDLCLMLSPYEIDGKREAVELLMVIQRALRKCSFIKRSQVIRARVPILKFEDATTHVECDLNINNSVGIRNTHLLKYYANMDWRVRPLVLFVKKWARFHDINDASKMTISSYSLCLLVIHYLQFGCNPPVLQSVQKLRPDLFNGDDIRNLRMTESIDFESENTDSLGDLFLGFLRYYAEQFSFLNDVASVRLGTKIPVHMVKRQTAIQDRKMWSCCKVEEPFDLSNTARSCYDAQTFSRVIRVFERSHRQLAQKRDLRSILTTPF